jgi:hypothetical protein
MEAAVTAQDADAPRLSPAVRGVAVDRESANVEAVGRLVAGDPVLCDVRPAVEVVPGMRRNLVLAAGPALPFADYVGPQRDAILHAAVHEGLAASCEEAAEGFLAGDLQVGSTADHACVGSSTGVHTASTPVLVVRNRLDGSTAYCGLYEARSRRLLSYGLYDGTIRARLHELSQVFGPTLSRVLTDCGGVELVPLMARALRMGDELHSRNLAASGLLARELTLPLFDLADREAARATLAYLTDTEPFFLRVSMAAARAIADAAHGVPGSSIVTGMGMNCREFALRVSGLGDEWFRSPPPPPLGRFFDGFGPEDVVWTGGESVMTETVGLGALAQACAFGLQEYQGGDPETMVATNLEMYDITVGEHPEFRIPYLGFRGTPVGIDIFRVVSTGCPPGLDIGYAGDGTGLIGAGMARAPIEPFGAAIESYHQRHAIG